MQQDSSLAEKNKSQETFSLWATSDPHVIREELVDSFDQSAFSRESMRIAVEQADSSNGFHYDIGICLGDLLDFDYETVESFQKYLNQLSYSSKDKHCWYHVGGNNDENSVLNDGVSIDNEYYRQYIDPVGEFTEISGIDNSRRPYPVTGTYERYYFDVGNIRFLFLSDRNDLPAPYGRGEGGYFVDGAITLDTYKWFVDMIIKNPDRIIAICCHHPLKDTTIGTTIDASWEGQFMTAYNEKNKKEPTNRLQSVLHQIYDIDTFDTPKFRNLLGQNTGVVDMWISGHVHHLLEQTFKGKGKYAYAFGGHHFNVGTICRFRHPYNIISAQSNLFTFKDRSNTFESSVYVHDHPSIPTGFYEPEHRLLSLKKPFQPTYTPENVTRPTQNITDFTVEQSPGEYKLSWKNENTGALIIKNSGNQSTFTPTDGETYYPGQIVENGTVVFMGTHDRVCDKDVTGDKIFYKTFSYNAGNDKIFY